MLGSLIILSNILSFKSGTQKTLLFVYFIAWKKTEQFSNVFAEKIRYCGLEKILQKIFFVKIKKTLVILVDSNMWLGGRLLYLEHFFSAFDFIFL